MLAWLDAQPSTRLRGIHLRGWRMLIGNRIFADLPTQLSWQLISSITSKRWLERLHKFNESEVAHSFDLHAVDKLLL